MNKQDILQKTKDHVKEQLAHESTGHDWWHIYRVWQLAKRLAQEEQADLFIVEMTALLHDLGDPKLHGGDQSAARRIVGAWLEKVEVPAQEREQILYIIEHMSFSKSLDKQAIEKSKELQVVQDADRLDAIGAMGIARAFAYGGKHNRLLHNPQETSKTYTSSKEYYSTKGSTINHFYGKLLLLKDQFNTQTARSLAQKRHDFMQNYLDEFYAEWEGKK